MGRFPVHKGGRGRARAAGAAAVVLPVLALVLVAFAGVARADSAAVGVTSTTGVSDPVAGLPRIVTVSGVASSPERIYVKERAAGGAPCAPSAAADEGTALGAFYADPVEGSFSVQDVLTVDAPGGVLFCTWLSSGDAGTIATPFSQVVVFRAPRASVRVAVRPARPRPGEQVDLRVTGSTEVAATLYAKVQAGGAARCATTYAAQPGQSLAEGTAVDGAFSLALSTTPTHAGAYRACVWIARSEADPAPLAGPSLVAFDVARPRCVVPSLGHDRRPAAVRRRIRAAHCKVGRTLRVPSRRVRDGTVIRLGRRPRTRLAGGTPIDLVVSSGPAPRHHRGARP
jgi:hypothetical protein